MGKSVFCTSMLVFAMIVPSCFGSQGARSDVYIQVSEILKDTSCKKVVGYSDDTELNSKLAECSTIVCYTNSDEENDEAVENKGKNKKSKDEVCEAPTCITLDNNLVSSEVTKSYNSGCKEYCKRLIQNYWYSCKIQAMNFISEKLVGFLKTANPIQFDHYSVRLKQPNICLYSK